MLTSSKRRLGFRVSAIQKRKEPHALQYLSERTSFWVAVLSLFAFVTGNMVGQHGWHVFWKSVMGKYDDSLIVYEGTVPPVAKVPDYTRWSLYGGDSRDHTFHQVPRDVLIPLPKYIPSAERTPDDQIGRLVYSVDHFGTYKTGGGEGGHTGIDIRLPEGTPVLSSMAGIVTRIADQKGGFGKYVLIRHPRVPDPGNAKDIINLYSLSAHLSDVLVSEGQIVHKGDQIGLSGQTGNASGPHLHYQIQRETCKDGTLIGDAAFWPFTTSDMREAGVNFNEAIDQGLKRDYGLQCTVNPMLYAQSNLKPVELVEAGTEQEPAQKKPPTVAERRAERIKNREARRLVVLEHKETIAAGASNADIVVTPAASVEKAAVVASNEATVLPATSDLRPETSIEFRHDGVFTRGWERVIVRIVDKSGNPVRSPTNDIYLRTAYGSAEFRPEILSPIDFENGEALLEMLPRGKTSVVIYAQPGSFMSAPMRYQKE